MAEQSGGQVGDDPALAAKALRTLPVQKDLRRIADKCGNNGEKLLTLVGLQLTEIQGFLMDASTSSDAFFQGLVYWLGGNVDDSDPVNWSTLLTAMEDASMARDAGEWRQKIIERCAASLDRPRDAGQSGNDKAPTPEQEEPRSNVPTSATTKDEGVLFPKITPLKHQFSELVSKVFVVINKLNEERMEELHSYLTTLLTPRSSGHGRHAKPPIVPKAVNELKEFLRHRWNELEIQVLEYTIRHLKDDRLTEMMAHYRQALSKEQNKCLSEYPAERAQTDLPPEATLVQFKFDQNLWELTLAQVSKFCRLICSWVAEFVVFRGYKGGSTVLFFSIPTECVQSLPSCLLPSHLSVLEKWKVLFFSVKGVFTVDISMEINVIDSLDKANLAGRPSTEDLISISRATGRKRKDLLRSLGIEETTIETLFDDNPNNAEEACYQGLRIWENENALKPVTWGTLIHALKMAELTKLANELLHKVNPQQQQERSPVALYQGGSGKPPAAFPSGPEQTKTLCDNPHIQDLKRHVMQCYKILKPSESRVRVEYVQLALLEAHDEDEEEMMKHKKGGGKKLDFLESFRSCGLKSSEDREFFDVADLLKPTSDAANRMKVVYGQAGIGKTTMLTHICRSLTSDKPMKSSYDLVLYFPLGDKAVSSAKTLSDLLSYYATADSDLDLSALRRAIVNSGDKEVLFIFDGADEVQDLLSSEERGVFQKFLEGRTLPQADVIVSSRPGGLPQLMEQNLPTVYEIHGLPMLSIEKYINDFFKSRPEKGERLWKELQSREDLMGAAHIPMNLLIFCHIFRKGGLPSTLTDCYKLYIVEVHNRESPEKKWKCFDQCSKDVEQLLFSLGRLAYNGLMSTPSTFVFEEEKVKKAFKTTSLDKSTFKGLLHEHPSIYEVYSNRNSTYNFSHTTQQELFCAYYISHLPVGEQIEFLRGNCSNRKFSMVLRFYAGLTGLVDEQVVHTVLHEPGFFDYPFLPKASTTGHSICARDKLRCDNDNPGLLNLFHFLYESQNSVLTQSVARHLDGKSINFHLFLTSYDTRVIAHCLRESHSFSHLGFLQPSIEPTDSKHLLSCVSSILMSVTHIQKLTLHLNGLTRTGGSLLKEGLARTAVEVMDLDVNRADMSAIAAVFEAPGLKTLKLFVWDDVDKISDSDHEVVQSSARNATIKELTVCSPSLLLLPVAKGLAANTCVEKLVLQSTGDGDDDGVGVGQALATTFTTNTTLKDIGLIGVSPFPLMEVLCSREVPLERLAIIWYSLSEDSSPCTLEALETLTQDMKVKRFETNDLEWSTEYLKALADGLSRNKFLREVVLGLGEGVPGDVKDYISAKLSTLETVEVYFSS